MRPIADTRNEGTETVELLLTPNMPNYILGTASANITIADDPQDVITIPTAYTVTEIATQQGTYNIRYAYSVNNNGMVVGASASRASAACLAETGASPRRSTAKELSWAGLARRRAAVH